ncbi:MAG TPA: hypothetical protein GXX70_02550 [Tepidimicrobium sp.]|nr:hypothetical protein [Tepidimicrobium sp.]
MTKMYDGMQQEFKEVDFRLDNLRNRLDDLEARNAERHLDLRRSIDNLRSDMTRWRQTLLITGRI